MWTHQYTYSYATPYKYRFYSCCVSNKWYFGKLFDIIAVNLEEISVAKNPYHWNVWIWTHHFERNEDKPLKCYIWFWNSTQQMVSNFKIKQIKCIYLKKKRKQIWIAIGRHSVQLNVGHKVLSMLFYISHSNNRIFTIIVNLLHDVSCFLTMIRNK